MQVVSISSLWTYIDFSLRISTPRKLCGLLVYKQEVSFRDFDTLRAKPHYLINHHCLVYTIEYHMQSEMSSLFPSFFSKNV